MRTSIAARRRDRDLGAAGRAAVDGDDDGRARRDGRVDRGQRQAVALVEPGRHVRARRRPRARGGRWTGSPGRSRPSASKSPKTRTRSPWSRARVDPRPEGGRHRAAARGRGAPSSGSANQARARPRSTTRGGQERRSPMPRARARCGSLVSRGRRRSGSGRASGSGVRARRQDATRGCTAAFVRSLASPGQDVGAAGARARLEAIRPWRRSSQSCQTTSSGAALKIEEYVPEMMPSSRARTKSLDRRAAEQEQREQREDDREAGRDRPPERLQDRVVHDLGRRARRRGAPCSRGSGRTRRSCRAR